MNVLLIHQFLWSHYKAGIFKELEALVEKDSDINLKVIQMATYEKSRIELGEADRSIHDYKYELLFDDVYENTTVLQRFKKTIKLIKEYKPDVVNLPGYYEPAMVMVHFWLKIFTNAKIILSVDSTENDNPNQFLKETIKKFIISKADGFFCYGSKSAEYMIKLGGKNIFMKRNSVNNDIVERIYNEEKVTPTITELAKKKFWFIYIGRFIELKNLPFLLKSFNSLQNKENWGLCFIGDGPDKTELIELGKNMERDLDSTLFLPAKDWKEIPKYLAHSNVLILPSLSEAWGLVVNEAMICEKPVIVSSQCGSVYDLVKPNKNGFMFDPTNQNELTEHMQFFVNNTEKINEFGENSKAIIQEFSPHKVAKDMFNGFKNVTI